jgi:polyphosphate kinase
MSKQTLPLINREISWLSFNERVLQEANDPTVPLLERLKFLGIFSSNRDEFFRVRVATVRRMIKIGAKPKEFAGESPKLIMEKIMKIINSQQEKFEATYSSLLSELERNQIFIVNEQQLNSEQGAFVKAYFKESVLPFLFPIMLDNVDEFPWLKDRAIYLIIKLVSPIKRDKLALVEIPSDKISRFLVLPKENKHVIMLDDVIRYCLKDMFFHFNYDFAEAFAIKMTRDAELNIENDVSKSLVKKISESVKQRKKGEPVRLEVDETISPDILRFISRKLPILKRENFIKGGRYHNTVDFIDFPRIGKPELRYTFPQTLEHPEFKDNQSVLKVIKHKDILLSYPYQSYHPIIDLLREASIDPKVKSIQITLYRVARNSNIVNALINAMKNGKQVTVIVELQARFDEERNIFWSNRLQEEGAKVIYGVPGLKAHTKLFLIEREENGIPKYYAHVGTGNFNEDTAKFYCDHSLLTSNKKITQEVVEVFNFYSDNYKTGIYKELLVSPFTMRKRISQLIDKEIKAAKEKQEAWIFLKMNNLVDEAIIKKLYDASNAGVKIRLIIRSTCSLVAGKKGLSDNIEAVSIVDKYLEHSRVFVFCNRGDAKYYLASADIMTRNLDHRSEVAVPIYDKEIQQELKQILEIQWSGNTKARILNSTQANVYKKGDGKNKVRAQDAIYEFLKKKGTITK